jgi:hypothetical protein
MTAPNEPVVAISAPEVMKMPPPMHPDIPIPTMLLRDGERVANAYLQVVA